MELKQWVRLPTDWIRLDQGLQRFEWKSGKGSDNVAALMLLLVIAHHADTPKGQAKLTYDELEAFTELSRAKISAGLDVLAAHPLILRNQEGRSSYRLANYKVEAGWGKLPAQGMYKYGRGPFHEFHLRRRVELDALKLYLLFVAMRNNASNMAYLSYDTIEEYTGIQRFYIKTAISFLVVNGLVHVEQLPRREDDRGVSNAYRLPHLQPYLHMGTWGRGNEPPGPEDLPVK